MTEDKVGFLQGLTKREYFAGLAMQGLLSNSEQMRYMVQKNLDVKCEIIGLSLMFADGLMRELDSDD